MPTCSDRLEFDLLAGIGEDPIKVLRRDFSHPCCYSGLDLPAGWQTHCVERFPLQVNVVLSVENSDEGSCGFDRPAHGLMFCHRVPFQMDAGSRSRTPFIKMATEGILIETRDQQKEMPPI